MESARRLWNALGRIQGESVRSHVVGVYLGAIVLGVLAAAFPAAAQAPDVAAIQAEVTKLKGDLETVQRELQDIKTLLRERLGPAAEERSVVIGLGDAPSKGAPDARVTLVELTDYQCPFCARHHEHTVPRLLESYVKTGKVRYVVRDFPLVNLHPAAVKAAEATHCASDSGKYWEMQYRVFANQRALSLDDLVVHAQGLGLDTLGFRQCLESGKYASRVREALAEGERAGVRGTPTFYLGLTEPGSGKITSVTTIRGAQPFAKFEGAIEKLLATPK
jgi:protein-disulfide isomerase